jgi:hypothetical protein
MVAPTSRSLTHERLKQVLNYEAETGAFTWAKPLTIWQKVGDPAGTAHRGYTRISIDGEQHMAHRLAWYYVHGEWPERFLDHANGVKTDNRLANLRQATQGQNNNNRRAWGKSAFKGVSWSSAHGKWAACIQANKVKKHLGFFTDEREAAEAYIFASIELHGEFARAA